MLVAAEAKREEEKAKGVSADDATDIMILCCMMKMKKMRKRKAKRKKKTMARNLKEGEGEEE
jgi:hypothetical protein